MRPPERRLLVSVDMERYSRRSNLAQYEAQQGFQQLLRAAAAAVGLDRVSWKTQQAGDGELAILPADVDEPRVIGRLVPELDRLVRRYNSSRLPDAKVRLRVALHHGMVHLDGANGFPGRAVNEACRLCDAVPLKETLAAFPDAGVALIVSAALYRDVVIEYPEELRPERFRRVEVHHADKDFREEAWIYVVDEDLSSLSSSKPSPPVDSGPAPGDGRARDARYRQTTGASIRTGEIRVTGQNAVGPGAMAIGSVGDNASFGSQGR